MHLTGCRLGNSQVARAQSSYQQPYQRQQDQKQQFQGRQKCEDEASWNDWRGIQLSESWEILNTSVLDNTNIDDYNLRYTSQTGLRSNTTYQRLHFLCG